MPFVQAVLTLHSYYMEDLPERVFQAVRTASIGPEWGQRARA